MKAREGLAWLAREEEREGKPDPSPSQEPALDPELERVFNWQRDNPPPPAMTQGQFADRALSEFSGERARQILALARPAIGLWPQRKTQVSSGSPFATRLDGQPWAPRGWPWPMFEQEPMYFLGQIHCPDLAGLPGAELLPRDGLLAFFGDFDAIAGCFPAGGTEQGAVYHWTETDLFPAEPPLPLDDFPEIQDPTPIVLRPFIDLPHPAATIVDQLGLGAGEKPRYRALWEALRHHGVPQEVGYHCDLDSKILGWPDLVQDEDFHLLQTGANAYRQLVQLPARLGPGGSLYFLMRDADLAQRRFDRCILEEQNT